MKARVAIPSLVLVLILGIAQFAVAEDYVVLKNGQTVKCAILRQDTSAVFTTDWNLRGMLQPPLQVFERSEVESIWFETPRIGAVRTRYAPRPSGIEGGGGFSLQTWAETELTRRYLAVLTLQGELAVNRSLGIQAQADFTFPFGGRSDSVWRGYRTGYQIMVNAVAHPIVWKGLVPFAVAGGGAALGVPSENVILSRSNDIRTLLDFGLGVKWGSGGVGYAVEWRHHYYSWTPDAEFNGLRASGHFADASVLRASIFVYR